MSMLSGEQLSQQIVITSAQVGINVTARLASGTLAGLKDTLRVIRAGLKHVKDKGQHGQMRLRNLQRAAGGDLHQQAVTNRLVATLTRDLKKRGVDFSLEKGRDGVHFIHFKGADADTMRHAVLQAEKRLNRHIARAQIPRAAIRKVPEMVGDAIRATSVRELARQAGREIAYRFSLRPKEPRAGLDDGGPPLDPRQRAAELKKTAPAATTKTPLTKSRRDIAININRRAEALKAKLAAAPATARTRPAPGVRR